MNRFERPEGSTLPTSVTCPRCGQVIGMSSGKMMGENAESGPLPGTFMPCLSCLSFFVLQEDYSTKPAGLFDTRAILEHPEIAESVRQLLTKPEDSEAQRSYFAQVAKMAFTFNAWKVDNPNVELSICYNYPKDVAVAGTLIDGIQNKFITANEAALQMFRELGWLDNSPNSPTIIMTQAVTEMRPSHKGKP